MTANLNLDTRRDAFGLTIDLNEAGPLIPIVVFDAPDDLRQPARLSLVSLEARASHRAAGWSDGKGLSEDTTLEPKGRATLAVSRDWLAERIALLRSQGEGAAAVVELPFSTILHLPRAPRASVRRLARIAVAAGASKPAVALHPATIDLDALPSAEADTFATMLIDIPSDIGLEANRSLVVETSCAGMPGESLSIEAEDAVPGEVSVRRLSSTAAAAARHLVSIERPEEVAGRRLMLALKLDRESLIGSVDRLLAASRGGPASLRVAAKVMGWGETGAAPPPGEPDRRFALAPPAVAATVASGGGGGLLIAIGEAAHAASLDGDEGVVTGPPVRFEADPEAAGAVVSHPGLAVAILRWPLGRTGSVKIEAEGHIGAETIGELGATLTPDIEETSGVRRGRTVLSLRQITAWLAGLVRSGRGLKDGEGTIHVALSSGGRPLLRATMPIELRRAVHRMPICIDLGASAISIWAGQARSAAQAFDLRPLPVGSWLAANVDPAHEEAGTLDGEAAVLIPSHIGLDPANNLRSDHAPHALRTPAQIGPGREAAKARMAHFGRRYDVSVPAPPPTKRGRPAGRRIAGLKHALATGRQTIALPEPVHRYDAAAGKLTSTSLVEVAPLAADVLDELVDLYAMRLCPDERGAEAGDPAAVAPRVVVTCPSGIGGEVEARYGAALGLFASRLDRLFPGASAFRDAAIALPEAVAAARYAAELLAPQMTAAAGEPLYLAALDLGASTSDVAVARVATLGGRLQRFEALSTFGLPAGGDAIDRALAGIVAPLVDGLAAGPGAAWTPSFEAADLSRALASDELSCAGAQQWFWSALRRAKAGLSEALLAREGPYRWPREAGPTLDIMLAGSGPDGLWRGLLQPASASPVGEQKLAEHAHAIIEPQEDGGARLVLRLGRPALEGSSEAADALARASAVLGAHLQRMARAAVPAGEKRPKVFVVPTGRAALWPPLFEALAEEAARGRDMFPLQRPLAPAVMKKAVVAGAALLSAQSAEAAQHSASRCPLAIAVTGTHLAEGPDGSLRTGSVAERVFYLSFGIDGGDRTFSAEEAESVSLGGRADLGQRFQFVRAAPGLDPAGRMLGELRRVLGHQDPVAPLEGDTTVEARAERIDRFGVCEVESLAAGSDRRRVTITARDRDWSGIWEIEGGRVARIQ
jgi:hypothetical protein